jgi:hypothetical protein
MKKLYIGMALALVGANALQAIVVPGHKTPGYSNVVVESQEESIPTRIGVQVRDGDIPVTELQGEPGPIIIE